MSHKRSINFPFHLLNTPLSSQSKIKSQVSLYFQFLQYHSVQDRKVNMGLSPYPTPTDAGVICVILVNTAMSITIMKQTLNSILHFIGIRVSTWDEYSVEHPTAATSEPSVLRSCRNSTESYMSEFRLRTPSIRFDAVPLSNLPEPDCPVCLTEFKPESEINHLACGHVFHNVCLEKWLKGWNFTCPLCRNHMIPFEEEEEETCPM